METSPYKVEAVLELARALKHGPLPRPIDPLPTVEEAIRLVGEERRSCGFNWLTGEAAERVLNAYLTGARANPGETCPCPEGTDEQLARQKGNVKPEQENA